MPCPPCCKHLTGSTDRRFPNGPTMPSRKSVADDPTVGVILFTAFTGELDPDEQRLGFTVLRKPLEIEGLHRALRDTLAGSASAS